ncbi:hypothetical protein [Solihabitans fulvus]|uniref:hypothetical protein n=1 Tax=Solihabitans fulvus TaxID=1892852 RepID=UPI003F667BE6
MGQDAAAAGALDEDDEVEDEDDVEDDEDEVEDDSVDFELLPESPEEPVLAELDSFGAPPVVLALLPARLSVR